jgi:predicted nucleic acid-binding protein
MGGVILDTSVLIEAERGRFDLAAFAAAHPKTPIAIAAITVAELLNGVARIDNPARRVRLAGFTDAIIAAVPVLPFGLLEARRHAEAAVALSRQGKPIGPHDLLIAATALARGFAVATRNQEEFSRVPGLEVIPTA